MIGIRKHKATPEIRSLKAEGIVAMLMELLTAFLGFLGDLFLGKA